LLAVFSLNFLNQQVFKSSKSSYFEKSYYAILRFEIGGERAGKIFGNAIEI
jgi:hypothetical protein